MSATLDGARVAQLLGDAPVSRAKAARFRSRRAISAAIRARGSSARSRTRSRAPCAPMPARCWCSCRARREIRRTETLLQRARRRRDVDVVTLFGALDAHEQDRAIAPAPPGRRKVVLATSIAETSLTIEGVRVVIDCGLSRVPRYEPDVGLTRLETVRVSRAAADQRRGRAGRTEPGVCYRLWDEPQTGSLEPYTRPEILSADLSSFVLDLAQWGAADPATLAFLDPPPAAALNEARALLTELGAIDAERRITDEGRKLRALPLPPRLARMVVDAAAQGAGQLRRDDRGDPDRARTRRRRRRSLPPARSISAATARAAPRTRARWRSDGSIAGKARRERWNCRPALCWRWPIPTASRKTAAARAARSCLATAAAATSIRPRPCARAVPGCRGN